MPHRTEPQITCQCASGRHAWLERAAPERFYGSWAPTQRPNLQVAVVSALTADGMQHGGSVGRVLRGAVTTTATERDAQGPLEVPAHGGRSARERSSWRLARR